MKKNIPTLLLAAASLWCAADAHADNDFVVYSPYVVQGQSEVETYTYASRDGRAYLNGAAGTNFSIGHAFTKSWKTEVYVAEFNRVPGGTSHPSGYEFENTFQLTSPGEYWADIGLLASYAYSTQAGVANNAELGSLLEKHSGHIDQRLNLIWGKQTSTSLSSAYQFRSAYSISYNIDYDRVRFSPGIELYYRPNDHAYQAGPILSGELRTDAGNELEYSVGIVFGTNQGAPSKTLLGRLGWDFF